MGIIAIIDYGMGNLRSVEKALQSVGGRTKVVSSPRDIKTAHSVVLPGVGAFGDAMRGLDRLGLIDPLRDAIAEGKPFLGLCLGLQLLFDKSEEAPLAGGLGILKGRVKRFARGPLKVPHMGWNNIIFGRRQNADLKILNGVSDNSYMYFVHSYYAKPKDESVILTETDYGIRFVSGIRKNNIFGFQFHPEKSQRVGLRVLRNFVNF